MIMQSRFPGSVGTELIFSCMGRHFRWSDFNDGKCMFPPSEMDWGNGPASWRKYPSLSVSLWDSTTVQRFQHCFAWHEVFVTFGDKERRVLIKQGHWNSLNCLFLHAPSHAHVHAHTYTCKHTLIPSKMHLLSHVRTCNPGYKFHTDWLSKQQCVNMDARTDARHCGRKRTQMCTQMCIYTWKNLQMLRHTRRDNHSLETRSKTR